MPRGPRMTWERLFNKPTKTKVERLLVSAVETLARETNASPSAVYEEVENLVRV